MSQPAAPVWNDTERLPGLSPLAQQRLQSLTEHPHAPIFRNRSGHRLTADDLLALQRLNQREIESPTFTGNGLPHWLGDFIVKCAKAVSFYQQYLPAAFGQNLSDENSQNRQFTMPTMEQFCALPTIDRSDLSRDITRFVPNNLPLDRLYKFTTTGTTGHRLTVPTHPLVAAQYAIFHQKALTAYGIDPSTYDSEVAVLLAGYQERCFTYLSVVPSLNERALLKLNFHPSDWQHPSDRGAFIEATRPALITGDPLSLHELSQLEFQHRPLAILSTSMTLIEGQQQRLQQHFNCPVVDIYSMNEAGPIGARVPNRQGFRLLQSRLLVEILDENGHVIPPGQRGEITLTGGFNPYLPLLRYRTGDHAALRYEGGHLYLDEFEGRPPVRYKTASGNWINNIEITHALQPFPLPQYIFHQTANGAITLRIRGNVANTDGILQALHAKLGNEVPIAIQPNQHFRDKVFQYTSDLAGAAP